MGQDNAEKLIRTQRALTVMKKELDHNLKLHEVCECCAPLERIEAFKVCIEALEDDIINLKIALTLSRLYDKPKEKENGSTTKTEN